MNPSWRTKHVVSICQAMREGRDYSACPILADALDDAGCDDAGLLTALRGELPQWSAERLVALVYSEETERAVEVIEAFAVELGPRAFSEEGDGYGDEVPVTYERLIRIGERWTAPGQEWPDTTTEHGSSNLQGWDDDAFSAFWDAYRAVTGKRGEGNPFSCTC